VRGLTSHKARTAASLSLISPQGCLCVDF